MNSKKNLVEVVNFENKIVPTVSHYGEDIDGYIADLEIKNGELDEKSIN